MIRTERKKFDNGRWVAPVEMTQKKRLEVILVELDKRNSAFGVGQVLLAHGRALKVPAGRSRLVGTTCSRSGFSFFWGRSVQILKQVQKLTWYIYTVLFFELVEHSVDYLAGHIHGEIVIFDHIKRLVM